jgi:hypothetical protein
MSAPSLKYSLTLDRADFEDADRLVRAVLFQGKPETPLRPRKVTDVAEHLRKDDQRYIAKELAKGGLDGLCYNSSSTSKTFTVWINPNLDPYTDLYRTTLLHELVHGYLREYRHGRKFRQAIGRVLYHYCDIVSPLQDPGAVIKTYGLFYSRRGSQESSAEYLLRLQREGEEIRDTAENEYSDILESYLVLGGTWP